MGGVAFAADPYTPEEDDEPEYYNDFVQQPDERYSDGRSGITTPNQFYDLPIPDPAKRDVNEWHDYQNTVYSPYGFLRVQTPLTWQQQNVGVGYYLVKLDVVTAPVKPPEQPKWYAEVLPKMPKFKPGLNYPPPYPDVNPQATNTQVQFVLKQQGEVQVVIPVMSSVREQANEKRNYWQRGLDNLKQSNRHPASPRVELIPIATGGTDQGAHQLEYCDGQICYRSIPLQNGLLKY
jgi:hypothetical protein